MQHLSKYTSGIITNSIINKIDWSNYNFNYNLEAIGELIKSKTTKMLVRKDKSKGQGGNCVGCGVGGGIRKRGI